MLMRISLIVAIIAGLAVGGLNFLKVKEKITIIQGQREDQRSQKEDALRKLASTQKELKTTAAELKTTQATLEATTAEKDQAVAKLASETKRADTVTAERDKIRKERDDAQAELAAYKATGLTPPQILAMNGQYKALQEENKVLASLSRDQSQKIKMLRNRLDVYESSEPKPVLLPANLRGKVLQVDPKWNFVVLDIGLNEDALEGGELLVSREGKLVGKVQIRSVQKDRCVANLLPGWQIGEIMEGDLVIPAHPDPTHVIRITSTRSSL